MAKTKILLIDDDVDICQLLKRFLERKNFEVYTAFKAAEGLPILEKNDIGLVLMDFRLPDMNGFDLIKQIKSTKPSVPVIVITGYSDVKQAVKSIQLGAFEYVTKPIYPEEILLNITRALSLQQPVLESFKKPIQKSISPPGEKNYVLGKSAKSKQVEKLIDLVAPTDMTVVILGDSGTGKEVAARMIHDRSKRASEHFIAVDCGALPQELAGSELFGHVKGAFTGAVTDKKGHFERAQGGTLFLDEIGNLSYENQIKLLRVLQERSITRVGDEKDIPVDVRIIVATNDDLKNAMRKGSFREDIYYRINEFKIELPTLSENIDDLAQYINFFLEQANKELCKNVQQVDEEAMDCFKVYNWPGNLRELKNVVKRAVLLSSDDQINTEVLPHEITSAILQPKQERIISSDNDLFDLKMVVEQAESEAIIRALAKTKNNKSKCAELLGIDRKTLYNKMNAYGLME